MNNTTRERYNKICSSNNSDAEDFVILIQDMFVEYDKLEQEIVNARREERERLRPNSTPVLEKFEQLFLSEDKYSSFWLFAEKYREPWKLWCMMEDIRTFIHNVDQEAEKRWAEELQKGFNDYAIKNAKSEYAQSAIILVRNFITQL